MLDRAHSVRDCAVKPARTFRIMHWNLDAVYGFSGGVEVLKTKLKNLRLVLHFYDVTAAVVTEIPDIDLDALLSENMMTKGSMVGYTWRKSPSTGARECVLFLVRDDGDEVQFETDAVCATWVSALRNPRPAPLCNERLRTRAPPLFSPRAAGFRPPSWHC